MGRCTVRSKPTAAARGAPSVMGRRLGSISLQAPANRKPIPNRIFDRWSTANRSPEVIAFLLLGSRAGSPAAAKVFANRFVKPLTGAATFLDVGDG
jgi:hypothetical protein